MSCRFFRSAALLPGLSTNFVLPLFPLRELAQLFLLSMLHWCGIGHRAMPLDFWQVFLIRTGDTIAGVSGLYRQPESPEYLFWLGWFGICPKFRRQGLGSAAIRAIAEYARTLAGKELWVYTGFSDEIAQRFYGRAGFQLLGSAREHASNQTMADSDIILKLRLDAS